jgi:hypothetical protein
MHRSLKHIALVATLVAFAMTGAATPAAAQLASPDTAQVVLQPADVTPDGHLTFEGHGFAPGETCSVVVEDVEGGPQAQLQPAQSEPDGQIYTVSVQVPPGLAPGTHVLHVTGSSSNRTGHATFSLRWQSPTVHLESYTGKPTQPLSFGGSGFVPGETVDVYLGEQATSPLTSVTADGFGTIAATNVSIPPLGAGDYKVTFIGHGSQMPVSVGFNIQGFHPWVVLPNYYIPPQSSIGFIGQDFVPGEAVQVYLNTTLSQPVTQVTADGQGRFSVDNAFALPNTSGDNELIFVGQQSQTEVTASFRIASPPAANP